MKKIILTLAISIIILGLTSVLFSFENQQNKDFSAEVNQSAKSQPNQLPSSQDSFLTASLNPNFIPIRNWAIEEPVIQAKASAVFDINGEKFLYQKNIKEKLPIASLTKTMTALVVLENLTLDSIVNISKKAVITEGKNGHLSVGEKLSVRNLLYIMLIESSNDAATALADSFDLASQNNFVALMNKKAKEIGMESTYFADSTGISKWNHSTISDLIKLTKYSFSNKPLIWQILSIKEIELYSQEEKIKHHLITTNKLLSDIPQIIAGKTGFTEEAGGCMLTMVKNPDKPGEYLIIIILGSEDRELETKKLIEWTQEAYVW